MNSRKIGAVAMILSILGFAAIAGGVEHLPPEAGIKEWITLLGASTTAFILGLLGISMIHD
jgi:hypothetical protein